MNYETQSSIKQILKNEIRGEHGFRKKKTKGKKKNTIEMNNDL
jgi:hypothetical protein